MDKTSLIIIISTSLGLASGILICALAGILKRNSTSFQKVEDIEQEKEAFSEELGHELSKLRESLAQSSAAYSNTVKVIEEKLPIKAELKKELLAPLSKTLHSETLQIEHEAESRKSSFQRRGFKKSSSNKSSSEKTASEKSSGKSFLERAVDSESKPSTHH